MKHDQLIRLGIVGCGAISHAHASAILKMSRNARFVACSDLRAEVATDWASQYGCERSYTDYEEMIGRSQLDGILLATWPNQHCEQIRRCLELGVRNILCEKALTPSAREATEIWARAAETGAVLMEGFMYRHHPVIRKLERILSWGEIGSIDSVRACFSAHDPETAPADDKTRDWRQRSECGGGIPYDFACYCVNACAHFTRGFPLRVSCVGSHSEKYGTVNRMYGWVEYQNGCVGMIESSKKTHFSQELQISCAQGVLTLPLSWTVKGTRLLPSGAAPDGRT